MTSDAQSASQHCVFWPLLFTSQCACPTSKHCDDALCRALVFAQLFLTGFDTLQPDSFVHPTSVFVCGCCLLSTYTPFFALCAVAWPLDRRLCCFARCCVCSCLAGCECGLLGRGLCSMSCTLCTIGDDVTEGNAWKGMFDWLLLTCCMVRWL